MARAREAKRASYAPTCAIRDGQERAHVYCARFCAIEGVDGKFQRTFATCAGTRADVWECEKSGNVVLVASFETRDANEAFYACEWCAIDSVGRRESGADATTTGKGKLRPCLALAGEGAVVRVVDCVTGRLHVNLVGHGGTVNSVVSHPSRPSVVATASKDLSVRLWHVNTGVTMAILAGARGHRNELLSVDFHPAIDAKGQMKLVTGAMDNCVKVWATPPLADSMAKAATWTKPLANFKTIVIDTPMFSSSSVHDDYVDCVGWLGDAVLSKSVDGIVKLWVPDEPVGVVHARGNQFRSVSAFEQKDANLWWIRFAVSGSRNAFALGNIKGLVLVWRLDARGGLTRAPAGLAAFPVRRSASNNVAPEIALDGFAVVRQCAINRDGDVVVAACDSGLICRWDLATPSEDDDDDSKENDEMDADDDDDDDDDDDENTREGRDANGAAASADAGGTRQTRRARFVWNADLRRLLEARLNELLRARDSLQDPSLKTRKAVVEALAYFGANLGVSRKNCLRVAREFRGAQLAHAHVNTPSVEMEDERHWTALVAAFEKVLEATEAAPERAAAAAVDLARSASTEK